jgi:copper transport protein
MYNPEANSTELFPVPDEGVLSGLAMDREGDLWIPVVQANTVVKFSVRGQNFTSFGIPTAGATPVGISSDSSGDLWLAEAAGYIARIDAATGNITEYQPESQRNELDEPTAVFPDPKGSTIFIAEHGGNTITAFSPLLGTFREYTTVNEAGLPFGMAMDGYGNLWFAQHEIDRLGVIDPRTGASTEAKIPITGSWIQWLTSDDRGRIWFAAQRGAALGSITITAKPAAPGPIGTNGTQGGGGGDPVPQLGFSLADVAGPAIAAGIAISALAYAKSTSDLRRNIGRVARLRAG